LRSSIKWFNCSIISIDENGREKPIAQCILKVFIAPKSVELGTFLFSYILSILYLPLLCGERKKPTRGIRNEKENLFGFRIQPAAPLPAAAWARG
jgi:hypothetical protein